MVDKYAKQKAAHIRHLIKSAEKAGVKVYIRVPTRLN